MKRKFAERSVTAGALEVAVAVELFVPFRSFVEESGVIPFPNQFDIADRAISLFCDDDLGLSSVLVGIFPAMVIPFAVDIHDHVRILFDST
jgi:hypothetical protein